MCLPGPVPVVPVERIFCSCGYTRRFSPRHLHLHPSCFPHDLLFSSAAPALCQAYQTKLSSAKTLHEETCLLVTSSVFPFPLVWTQLTFTTYSKKNLIYFIKGVLFYFCASSITKPVCKSVAWSHVSIKYNICFKDSKQFIKRTKYRHESIQ